MAGGGDEFGFRQVGFVGLALGKPQRDVQARELLGALAHAALERLVGALQRLRRFDTGGDVSESSDDAAIGHMVGTDLNHLARLGEAFEERLAAGHVALDLRLHKIVDFVERRIAPLGIEVENIGKSAADSQ